MRFCWLAAALVGAVTVCADDGAEKLRSIRDRVASRTQKRFAPHTPRSTNGSTFLSETTEKFAVNGTDFPGVPFDIGESYAGLLPITNNASDPRQLFFWFFPTTDPDAPKDITIWLQGGPGCSSLIGLLQENGPFLWQPGVYEPFANPYSWTSLTNMIWVDQPFGVGFSAGEHHVKDNVDAAEQFMGFWKNFVDVFSMQGYNIYIVSESYGGRWGPYLAGGMLDKEDDVYFNVKGIELIDAFFGNFDVYATIPMVPFVQAHNEIFNFNSSYMEYLTTMAAPAIEYFDALIDQYPPAGPFPPVPVTDWDVTADVVTAATYINPCFNPYHITETCPFPWNELQIYGLAAGPHNFFNSTAVQAALHVPPMDFALCIPDSATLFYNNTDPSSARGPLPGVIERTNNVVISHGDMSMVGLANGSLLMIQNMTWGGLQGFQTPMPGEPNLFMPYHRGLDEIAAGLGDAPIPMTHTAAAGLLGKWHSERGVTFARVTTGGHMMPQYNPGVGYRLLELMLGRIPSLNYTGYYTGLVEEP